jgi:hypothetical protein
LEKLTASKKNLISLEISTLERADVMGIFLSLAGHFEVLLSAVRVKCSVPPFPDVTR